MIGTVICRNCDTAIEVSEGDVTRFRASPAFACSVCQQDLSQRMAELIGRSPSPEPVHDREEFTVPEDEEVYDGLPVKESFDDAAQKLKKSRRNEPTPVIRNPEPTPIIRNPVLVEMEDPATLALRFASQAQAQAAAFAAKAGAADDSEPPTGVMPIFRSGVPAQAAPDMAPTQPGTHDGGAASTEVGVVPEEPENEPTVKRDTSNGSAEESVGEPTEPGGPAPVTTDRDTTQRTPGARKLPRGPQEETPLLSHSGGATPEEPINEPTPDKPRTASPFAVPAVPRREVTIRKVGAPPPISRAVPAGFPPRTGTGPAGIGVLGIRVVSTRAVVRPTFNGRPMQQQPGLSNDTQVSGEIMRPPALVAPAPVAEPVSPPWQEPRKPLPRWLVFGGAGIALLLIGLLGSLTVVKLFPSKAVPTPYLIPTPTPIETSEAAATRASIVAAPATTAVVASPVRTVVTAAPTITAPVAPTIVSVGATPAPTPRPGPEARAKPILEKAKKVAENDVPGAMGMLASAVRADPTNEDLVFGAYSIAGRPSREYSIKFAEHYVKMPNADPKRLKDLQGFLLKAKLPQP